MKQSLFFLFQLVFVLASLAGDTLFIEQFSPKALSQQLSYNPNAEVGHLIGRDNSDYVRLHPRENGFVKLPLLEIPSQGATLYYDWMKSGNTLPDTFAISVSVDGINFTNLRDYKFGTGRSWLRDSLDLMAFAGFSVTIAFNHYTSGVFPSQYLNLDNLLVKANATPTSILTELSGVSVTLFPNPAHLTLHLEIDAVRPQHLTLRCFNMAGKVLSEETITVSGMIRKSIATYDLPAGIYFLELTDGIQRLTKKFVVQ